MDHVHAVGSARSIKPRTKFGATAIINDDDRFHFAVEQAFDYPGERLARFIRRDHNWNF
jgi:hypothetical protein